MKILVTGGAGFIGSCFVRLALKNSDYKIVNFDKLTYAGNLENLASIEGHAGYQFVKGDIADPVAVEQAFGEHKPDAVVHFAAESHVDRSILSPLPVFETNLRGSFTLLEAARTLGIGRFVHATSSWLSTRCPGRRQATRGRNER